MPQRITVWNNKRGRDAFSRNTPAGASQIINPSTPFIVRWLQISLATFGVLWETDNSLKSTPTGKHRKRHRCSFAFNPELWSADRRQLVASRQPCFLRLSKIMPSGFLIAPRNGGTELIRPRSEPWMERGKRLQGRTGNGLNTWNKSRSVWLWRLADTAEVTQSSIKKSWVLGINNNNIFRYII